MKKYLFLLSFLIALNVLDAQVGINSYDPTTTLNIVGTSPATKVEGIIIPRFTGDQIFNMPIASTSTNESNLVYATSAASLANQVGRGSNLKSKGFFYWDGVSKWVSMINETTISNSYTAFVKPMNIMLSDKTTYTTSNPFFAPGGPGLKKFAPTFTNAGDAILINNPLSVTMWDSTNKLIKVPQQLLGYTITINLSLRFPQVTSNSEASRFVGYTGNTTVNTTDGTFSGGVKLKELYFKSVKTGIADAAGYSRDELVLSPIIVTQDIITHGIALYLGSADNTQIKYIEPILTIDYGVVNTTL